MSAEQKALADTLAIVVGLIVYVLRAVFAVLLFILVVKAIKYSNFPHQKWDLYLEKSVL